MTQRLVDVIVEDEAWFELDLVSVSETAARQTLVCLDLDPEAFEISLLGCNNARIAELNSEFRGKVTPTNVLSWPSEDRASLLDGAPPLKPEPVGPGLPEELGDIAIARETCVSEANEAGRPLQQHVSHLVVHGVLHLLGYDHERDKDADLMERLEVEILERMGIPSPYSESGDHSPAKMDR